MQKSCVEKYIYIYIYIYKWYFVGLKVSQNCIDINTATNKWGHEISWELGTCVSSKIYDSHKSYNQKCCLKPNKYTLLCYDSYGDGWNGGFVEIFGRRYCDDFNGPKSQIEIEMNVVVGERFCTIYCSRFIILLSQ